ncbi:MAG: amidohydrolase family protein [Defluviitaleaceae bacterium]|nr:amidohydrolase family protein [Defluviitaleaceae bacterium]
MKKHIDTLYSGAVFHTLCTEGETFSYMGETGGNISYLSNERPDAGEYKREIKLDGLHVYPSFTDAHLHLLNSIVLAASGFDACEIRDGGVKPNTISGVGVRIREYCNSRGADDMIVANNYIASAIAEKRLPTREELDEWADGRRTVIYSIDGHSSSLSTSMLKALGIDPQGHTGVLTGADHEFWQGRVRDVIGASIGVSDIARGVADFTNQCAQFGITRVCAMEGNGDSPKDRLTNLLATIARRMDVDVYLYPQYMELEKARPLWKKSRRPRIGGCGDWEVDGAVGSHSAVFYSPYIDTGETAEYYYSQDEMDEAVARADAEGCQISVHAIGEAAIDRILESFEKLGSKELHRIEHFEFPTDEAVEKLIDHGNIAITVQPGFAWIDKRYLKSYESYLPPEIAARQVPLKRIFDAGVALCATSDSPIQSLDPFVQILGMVDFSVPGQSLSNYEALRCYTANPARVLGQDNEFGVLAVGKEASFFATETDLISVDADAISGVHAVHTFIRGKKLGGKKGTVPEFLRMMLRRPQKI